MKKIISVILLYILTIQNVFGSTLILEDKKDNVIYRQYEVNNKENNTFYNELEENTTIDNIQYQKVEYEVSGGNEKDTIEVTDTKEIITKTNSLKEILNYLPREIEYNKDGYMGKTNLNIDDIEVYELYNGYYEVYVEETKQYFDLPKNDMDYIPKEITKDGITLYLINVDWYTQTTKFTGDIEITDLYRGEAHYKGVKKIDNPRTYKIVAGYAGTATKEIEKPYIYLVKYEEIIEEKQNIVIPIVTGTTSCIFIVVVILFSNSKKVKVYNLVYGRYKYLGNFKIKNSILDFSKSRKKVFGNRYKFVLSESAYKKYKNKDITIKKNDVEKIYHIDYDKFETSI